jgi:predicted ribosomally synthesized peptide with nif11-like leader
VQEISFGDPKAIIAYGRELGFEFDEKDLEELGSNVLEQSDELSEEELEMVSGGFVTVGLAIAAMVGVMAGAALVAGAIALAAPLKSN